MESNRPQNLGLTKIPTNEEAANITTIEEIIQGQISDPKQLQEASDKILTFAKVLSENTKFDLFTEISKLNKADKKK
jgi:hypothetical protein